MKKLSFMPVFLLVICGFLFSQTGERVYIAGNAVAGTDGDD
jgi:cell shape-determining protein MreD